MSSIETKKINLIIENKGSGKLLENFNFNEETMLFLKNIYNEYENFIKNRTN